MKLYIITATQDNVLRVGRLYARRLLEKILMGFLQRIGAILHSLHRAIITSPTPLPDTVFSISINDIPRPNTWSFVRSDDEFSPHTPWLMPHFSSWSWPLPYVGPLGEALTKIEKYENRVPWLDKIDTAIWRGTPWFNPGWSVGLRPKLVEITEGKGWADVQVWGQGQDPKNTLNIDEFCKYRYIIYAEVGHCAGALIIPPILGLI